MIKTTHLMAPVVQPLQPLIGSGSDHHMHAMPKPGWGRPMASSHTPQSYRHLPLDILYKA
jgi:hypothetical protein